MTARPRCPYAHAAALRLALVAIHARRITITRAVAHDPVRRDAAIAGGELSRLAWRETLLHAALAALDVETRLP